MSKAVPWEFDNLGAAAREATRRAACEAGLSVGELLDILAARQGSFAARQGKDSDARVSGGGRHDRAPRAHGPRALPEPLARTALRMVETEARGEVRRQFAATGTDGGAGFPPGVIMPGAPTGDALRSSTALQSMSDRLARFEQQAVTMAAPGFGPSSSGAESRPASMRDSVAEIARRQALLDEETDAPSRLPQRMTRDIATPEPEAARSIGALGEAVSALEARLASSRAAGPRLAAERKPADALPNASGAAPGASAPDASAPSSAPAGTDEAFEALSHDLRRALANIDGREVARPHPAPQPDAMWEDIRALLDRFRPGAALDTLDQRVKALSDRLEQHFEAPASSSLIESLSKRIEEMHASLKAAAPGPDMRSLETLVRGVASRIEDAREASADIQSLEDTVRRLAEKVEASRSPFDAGAVNALEAQIGRLAERLERSEASLSSLDAVERSLSDLFTQVEQTRHAAIDAAETAARTAARDTLRAALQHPGVGRPAEGTSQAVERVGQDVVDLRVRHEEAERRTQATLTSLHDTMGRLLGHIEALDLAGHRDAPQRIAPATAQAAQAAAHGPDRRVHTRKAAESAPTAARALPASSPPSAETPAAPLPIDLADSLIEPRPAHGRAPDTEFEPRAPLSSKVDFRVEAPSPSTPDAAVLVEGPASFIAAARRAAQAAQAAAAEAQPVRKAAARPSAGPSANRISALRKLDQAKAFLARRRRPVLLGLAGLVLLIGALEIVKVGTGASRNAEFAAVPAIEGPAANEEAGTLKAAPPTGQAELSPLSAPAAGPRAAEPAPASTPSASVADRRPDAGRGGSVTAPSVTAQAATVAVAPVPTATAPPAAAPLGDAPKLQARPTNPFLAGLTPSADGLPEGLRALATGGNAAAQYEVGLRFAEGRAVTRDPKAAANWFEKAAAQGLAPAQYRLGSAYEKGTGEARDPALAMTLYGRAADAGNIRAMHNLAVMAAEGAGGKPDYAKAATWFSKAASYGVRDSEFNLAILYARGLGTEQSLEKSYMWFAIAAAQGDEDAAKKRDDVGARLDPKALASAKAAAEAFRPITAPAVANVVSPPPGGWDGVAAPAARPPAGGKSPSAKNVMM